MTVSRRVTPASIAWSTYPRDRRAPKTPSELPDQVRVPKGSPHDIPRIRVLDRDGSGDPISILTISFKAFSKRHFDWGETRLHERSAVFALCSGCNFRPDKPGSLLAVAVHDLRIPPLVAVQFTLLGGLCSARTSDVRRASPEHVPQDLFRVIAWSIPPRYGLGYDTRRNLPAGGRMIDAWR